MKTNKKDTIKQIDKLIKRSSNEDIYNASQDDLLKAIAIGIKYLVEKSR